MESQEQLVMPVTRLTAEDEQKLDRIELKRGTTIKLGGYPFVLAQDTVILGRTWNYQDAVRYALSRELVSSSEEDSDVSE